MVRLIRRTATAVALLAALAVPLTVSGPAEAATAVNWARPCSTTHSHPLSHRCTVTPPIWHHVIQYRDAAGRLHTIHSPRTAWSWARLHSKPCRIVRHHPLAAVACYGHDELTGKRVFVYRTGLHVVLSAMH